MTNQKLTEYSSWIGKIADIFIREKRWNILLHKRTFNGSVQKIYINFQNVISRKYIQVGDIVEIKGIIQVDYERNSACRWGNSIKTIWTDREVEPKVQQQAPQVQPQPQDFKMDFEFENLLEELDNEVKKL